MKILIIGVNTRHIACSAKRAGHMVYALDSFSDMDLEACCEKLITWDMPDLYNLDLIRIKTDLIPLIRSILPVDAIVLGPGFEQQSDWIKEITGGKISVLNNPSHVFTRVSDKINIARKLKNLNLPHPDTVYLESITRPDDWISGYPAIIKPRCGAGGIKNILIRNNEDLATATGIIGDNRDQYILQKYIYGTIASVSVISSSKGGVGVAVNEHLAGIQWLTEMPFAYCGNITPHLDKYNEIICKIAVELALDLQLVGSNGIDFIITDNGPVVLEVNPRFQGSIDTIEMSTGINIFQAHYCAFNGKLPEIIDHNAKYKCYSIRAILFSPERLIINNELYDFLARCFIQGIAVDVPHEGSLIEKDRPLTSVIFSGSSRKEIIKKAEHLVSDLKNIIKVNRRKINVLINT
jgi:predicted ATP-grasp superfamily ATP-dependent carboligase